MNNEVFGRVSSVKALGKVAVAHNQTNVCPGCGCLHLARFSEGRWRCNQCTLSGIDEAPKTQNTTLMTAVSR